MKSDLVDIVVHLHRQTNEAVLVSDDGEIKNAVWIPKSQCEIEKSGKYYEITMPEWLAKEKGLI